MPDSTLPPRIHSSIPPRADDGHLVRGAMLGRYLILEELASGGMGTVYIAYDTQLDRKLAIKLVHSELGGGAANEEVQARILREAQAMARLTHPNVVTLHDVGMFGNRIFLAMEYVDGCTLREWLKEPHSQKARLTTLKAVGRGLAAAHGVGIVHRDLKPDNVLVGKDGRVLVTDFGLARAVGEKDEPESGDKSSDERRERRREHMSIRQLPTGDPALEQSMTPFLSELTLTGSVLGTVGYLAPEQAFGEVTNEATDLFSYCATLYLALYGEKPFAGDSLEDYLESVEGFRVREPPKGSRVPSWLRRVMLKGLAPEPKDRYPSMQALLEALEHDPAIARRRWMAIGGAIASVGVATVGYHELERRQNRMCQVAPSEFAQVWDDDIRHEIRARFQAEGGASGADTYDRASRVVDGYVAKWSQKRTEACELAVVHHQMKEEVYKLTTDCLDRKRTELAALTEVFRHADGQTLTSSVKAAYGLGSLEWCNDIPGLKASAGLPDDPEKRAKVKAARQEMAEAESLFLSGKYKDALPVIERSVATARQAEHRATESEALFLEGFTLFRKGDNPLAVQRLRESVFAGYAAGADANVLRAASLGAFVTGDKLYRPTEASELVGLAEAALERVGRSDELETELIANVALVKMANGVPEEGGPMLERAIAGLRRIRGSHPSTALALNNYGYSRHLAGKNGEAFLPLTESHDMLVLLYGHETKDSGVPLCNMGAAHLALGELKEADAWLGRAYSLFQAEMPDGFWPGWALQYMTLSARLGGDLPRAKQNATRGLAIMNALKDSLRLVPGNSVTAAEVALANDDARGALQLCDHAVEVQEKVGLINPTRVYEWDALRCRGEALLALGRSTEAILPLERAVAMPRRVFPWDLPLAEFALARALLAERADREGARAGDVHARATALAVKAKAVLVTIPAQKGAAAEITKWIQAKGP